MGLDGITTRKLKNCLKKLAYFLVMSITGCLVHGFLPESKLSLFIVPVIKDKADNINSKDYYHPMSLASIISKVIEIIMLN